MQFFPHVEIQCQTIMLHVQFHVGHQFPLTKESFDFKKIYAFDWKIQTILLPYHEHSPLTLLGQDGKMGGIAFGAPRLSDYVCNILYKYISNSVTTEMYQH